MALKLSKPLLPTLKQDLCWLNFLNGAAVLLIISCSARDQSCGIIEIVKYVNSAMVGMPSLKLDFWDDSVTLSSITSTIFEVYLFSSFFFPFFSASCLSFFRRVRLLFRSVWVHTVDYYSAHTQSKESGRLNGIYNRRNSCESTFTFHNYFSLYPVCRFRDSSGAKLVSKFCLSLFAGGIDWLIG